MVLLIFSILITLLLPLPSVIINFFAFIFSNKFKKIHGFLFALSLACVAYVWIPENKMDLYRWYQTMDIMKNYTFNDLLMLFEDGFEFFNYFIIFIINKFNNHSLLQFIVALIGYFEIFWIIADYQQTKKFNKVSIFLSTTLILLSLDFIGFISGLWFNLAIINFSLGIYLKYFKEAKILPYIFFIISIFTHISTIFIFIIYLIVIFSKSKFTFKKSIVLFIIFLLIDPIIVFLNSNINSEFIHYIYKLYNSYFINGDRFASLHNGTNMISAVSRIIFCSLVLYYSVKKSKNVENIIKYDNKYTKFVLYTSISVLAILFNATVFVRFAFFVELISIPLIMDLFNNNFMENFSLKKRMVPVLIFSIFIICLMAYRQNNSIKSSNLPFYYNKNILNNIFSLDNGGN